MTLTTHNPEDWRDQFPILASTTYLVNHSLGAMPVGARTKLTVMSWLDELPVPSFTVTRTVRALVLLVPASVSV